MIEAIPGKPSARRLAPAVVEDVCCQPPEGAHWGRTLGRNRLLAAMAKAGGASVASGVLSALATKVVAVFAGPGSVALLSTLQQTRQMALLLATGNGQTALVQGASMFNGRQRSEYVRTLACLFAGLTSLLLLSLAAMGDQWGRLAGAGVTRAAMIGLTVPLALSSGFVFLSALLMALGAVGRLALVQIFTGLATLAGALLMIPAATGSWFSLHQNGRESGVLPAGSLLVIMTISGVASLIAVLFALWPHRQTLADWFGGAGRVWSNRAAAHFFSISAALAVSGILASAVLLFVRSQITASQGLAVTGQWDAAWNISMNQAGLVLASMQTHYLPELARTKKTQEKARQISDTLTTGSLLAALVIAGVALTKPWLLQTLYAQAFRPAAAYLRWTLAGDYLKVGSWILSIPILAAGDMKLFLAADLAAYAAFVVGSLVLARWLGAASAASVAFVLMYAIHLIICGGVLRLKYGVKLDRRAAGSWLGGLALVLLVTGLTWNFR